MYLILLLLVPIYAYNNNWFPIIPISCSDFKNPKEITILGKEYVLWKKNNEFILQDNICPHRCAPLSEGYIDKTSNNLRCSYHGWEFDENGKNTVIPQLETNKRVIMNSCIKSYPTSIYGDILWCYLGNNITNITPENMYNINNDTVFYRQLPIGFHIILENLFDPAHIPFAHHKLQSIRSKGQPIKIGPISQSKNLMIYYQDDYNVGVMKFVPPSYYNLNTIKPINNFISKLHIFLLPIEIDKTGIFIKYDLNKNNKFYKIFNLFPFWLKHILINRFLDSDTYILHKQEKNILRENNSYFENHYYMPSKSDDSIKYYKSWMKKKLMEIPFYRKHNHNLNKKEDILDHYNQHTKHCTYCKSVLKNINFIEKFLIIVLWSKFVYSKKKSYIIFERLINFILTNIKKQFIFQDYVHNNIN